MWRSERRRSRPLRGWGAAVACVLAAGCTAPGPGGSPPSGEAVPSATASSTVAAPVHGWDLGPGNTGLGARGLTCEALVPYTGPADVPAGTTISERRITYPLNLAAGRITIEDSCIQPTTANPGLPILGTTNYNNQHPPAGAVVVRDSEFDGSRLSQRSAAEATAFIGIGTLTNNYVHGFGSGIALMNTGGHLDALVERNYVTGLVAWGDGATSGNHSDAFTIRDFDASRHPDRRAVVRNNRFDCDSGNDTGALFVQTYAGPIQNVEVEGNLLEGGGYQLGLNRAHFPYRNLRAWNNRFTGTGYGPAYVQEGEGWTQWQDNYLHDPQAADARGAVIAEP